MDLKEYLKEKCGVVDNALKTYLPPENQKPESVNKAIHYSMFAGGKRLRPILAIATYEMYSKDIEKVFPAACALEMVHTFSLIHDDLPSMDDDDYRRGKLTNHKVFGEAIAILAGDALCVEAFGLLAKTGNVEAIKLLAESVGVKGVIGGQVVDIESEGKPGDAETLDFIHNWKTAALIKASIMMGGIYAEASESDMKHLEKFGEIIGLIFQIVDDILDVTSTAEVLGKNVGCDAARGKLTYPSIYGVEASHEKAQNLLKEAIAVLKNINKDTTVLKEIAHYFIKRIN